MRRFRIASLAALTLLIVGVLIAPSTGSEPSAPATGRTLYVDAVKSCPGDGSLARPFCSITAAAAVAGPGDVVTIEPGTYAESVTLTHSGTATAPITFAGVIAPTIHPTVRPASGTAFNLTGVGHLVIKNLDIISTSTTDPIVVINDSTDITLDSSEVTGGQFGVPSMVSVTGASQDVRITRDYVVPQSTANGVTIGAGVSGALVSANVIKVGAQPMVGVSATDDPGVTVTSNTIATGCATAVAIGGSSTGAAIYNNIVSTSTVGCTVPSVSLSSGSVSGSTADYNLIDPRDVGPLYSWAGTAYATVAAFTAATGQGTHDIGADPLLDPQTELGGGRYYGLMAGSPAIDSADAGAPGELATDEFDNYRADDPDVTDSGTGVGYADRGAFEWGGPSVQSTGNVVPDVTGAPLTATATLTPGQSWATNGPFGYNAFIAPGQTYWTVTRDNTVSLAFARAGTYCVQMRHSNDHFKDIPGFSGNTCTTVGAAFTPVTPVRVLDTRNHIGISTSTPIPAGGSVFVALSGVGMPALTNVSAVVLNVTATQPTTAGFLTVYPDENSVPTASNLNFAAHQTVANVATVAVGNGGVWIRNGGSGTVHIIADFAGYYGSTGNNLASVAPTRVLDTRNAIGVPGTTPLGAHATITVNMSAAIPASAQAVVLNMTATGGTAAGFLTAFASGTTLPATSSLNYTAGATIANEVIVPVSAGKISINNNSTGTVHVIADLMGWFGPASAGATEQFVPDGPIRLLDTRGSQDGPLTPHQVRAVSGVWPQVCNPVCPVPTTFVLNITATQPTAAGYLTVYPIAATPPNTSTLNFKAGQTVANATTVHSDFGDFAYNGSTGTVQLIADEQGYYINPARGNG